MLISTFSGLQCYRWQYRSIFIRLAVVASQICKTLWNSPKIQTYNSSRSSKVSYKLSPLVHTAQELLSSRHRYTCVIIVHQLLKSPLHNIYTQYSARSAVWPFSQHSNLFTWLFKTHFFLWYYINKFRAQKPAADVMCYINLLPHLVCGCTVKLCMLI